MASSKQGNLRYYFEGHSFVFNRRDEEFGVLSNISDGFPVCVNGVYIPSTEALYQLCKYPHIPEFQREIILQTTSSNAKLKSNRYKEYMRTDWVDIRFKVMNWVAQVKFATHWDKLIPSLLKTGDKAIIEESATDRIWGAVRTLKDNSRFAGKNAIGRILMKIREDYKKTGQKINTIVPPDIENFLLFNRIIEDVIILRNGQIQKSRIGQSNSIYDESLHGYLVRENLEFKNDLFSGI